MTDETAAPALPIHGGTRLPSVEVDSYNVEIRDEDGFLGDRITKSAFCEVVDHLRKLLRKQGEDPLGDGPTEDLNKKLLDKLLAELKAWRDTARLAIGGGFRASRVGELVIGRAGVILKSDKVALDLVPIRNDPNAAGLIGAAHLVPSWVLKGHDAILAADLGGTNFRAGVWPQFLSRAMSDVLTRTESRMTESLVPSVRRRPPALECHAGELSWAGPLTADPDECRRAAPELS